MTLCPCPRCAGDVPAEWDYDDEVEPCAHGLTGWCKQCEREARWEQQQQDNEWENAR